MGSAEHWQQSTGSCLHPGLQCLRAESHTRLTRYFMEIVQERILTRIKYMIYDACIKVEHDLNGDLMHSCDAAGCGRGGWCLVAARGWPSVAQGFKTRCSAPSGAGGAMGGWGLMAAQGQLSR